MKVSNILKKAQRLIAMFMCSSLVVAGIGTINTVPVKAEGTLIVEYSSSTIETRSIPGDADSFTVEKKSTNGGPANCQGCNHTVGEYNYKPSTNYAMVLDSEGKDISGQLGNGTYQLSSYPGAASVKLYSKAIVLNGSYVTSHAGYDCEGGPVYYNSGTGSVKVSFYKTAPTTYTVTFKNYNGNIISSTEYEAGATISVPANPTKPSDGTYKYTFNGWTPTVSTTATGDATYTATFTRTPLAPTLSELYIPTTVENGTGYAVANATFPEADPGREVKWELLLNDGNGNDTPAEFETLLTVTDPANQAEVDIANLLNTTDVTRAQNKGFALNGKGAGNKDINTITITDGDITSQNLAIGNLTLEDGKTINGCFIRFAVKARADGEWYYSNWAKLNIDNVNRFFGYEEVIRNDNTNTINWEYAVDGNGEIVVLYTKDKDLSAIVDQYGILHVPSTVNGIVVRGIGGGTAENTFVPRDMVPGFTSIDIPNTVTTINEYAFAGVGVQSTASEEYATNGDNYVKVRDKDNRPVAVLQSVEIPSTVQHVRKYAFANTFVQDVTSYCNDLGEYAFSACYDLENVEIYGHNPSIKKGCFMNSDVKNLTFGSDSSASIGQNAFANNRALASLYVPAGTVIDNGAFSGCNIKELQVNCTELPANAFEGCPLEKVIMETGVRNVASNWAGADPAIADGAVFWVKNKNTRFDGQIATSPFGNSSRTTYINYIENEDTATAPSFGSGYFDSSNINGNCYAIDCSNDKNDDNAKKYTKNGTLTLIFHNGGTLKKRDGESDNDFAARQNKNNKYGDDLIGTGALEDLMAGLDDTTELFGLEARAKKSLFVYADINGKEYSLPLTTNDVEVIETGSGKKFGGTFFIVRESDADGYDYGDFEDAMNGKGSEPGLRATKTGDELADIYDLVLAELKRNAPELLRAKQSDITNERDKYGSFDAYVIVPNHIRENNGNRGAYVAKFPVNVQVYSAVDYLNQEYKNFDEIATALIMLNEQIELCKDNIEQYQAIIQNIMDILENNPDLVDEQGNVNQGALRDKLEELQDQYNALSAEEKDGTIGKMLQDEIKAIQAMLAKAEELQAMMTALAEEQQKLNTLNAQYTNIKSEFDNFCKQFDSALIGFTQVKLTETGTLSKYSVFIDDHEYVYYPTETVNETVEGADLLTKPIITAHVDPEVEPNAPDIDGNNDGKFRFFQSMGVCYILEPGKNKVLTTCKKELVDSIEDMSRNLQKTNNDLQSLNTDIGKINSDAEAMMLALKDAGFDVTVADDATTAETITAIKAEIADFIKQYNDIREKIVKDPNADPEEVMKTLQGLVDKIAELQKTLGILANENDFKDSTISDMNDELQAIKDSIAAKEEALKQKNDEIAGLKAEIEKLEKQIGEGNMTPSEIQQKLQELLEAIKSIKSPDKSISSLETQIRNLSSKVSDIKPGTSTPTDLSGVQSELGSIKSQLSTLQTKGVTTTGGGGGYYGGGGTSTSKNDTSKTDTTKVTKEEHKHDWKYTDNKDGKTHTKKCAECGEIVSDEKHEFDEVTGICVCGAKKDPNATIELKKEIVDQETCEHKWKYTVNDDGTHTKVCSICQKEVTEPHDYTYNKDEHLCECGQRDPAFAENSENRLINWKTNTDINKETIPTETEEEEVVEEEEEKSGSLLPWLIGIAVIMLGVVAFVVWKFVIQNKNKADDDDGFDDDDDDFMSDNDTDENAEDGDDLNDISLDDNDDFGDDPDTE